MRVNKATVSAVRQQACNLTASCRLHAPMWGCTTYMRTVRDVKRREFQGSRSCMLCHKCNLSCCSTLGIGPVKDQSMELLFRPTSVHDIWKGDSHAFDTGSSFNFYFVIQSHVRGVTIGWAGVLVSSPSSVFLPGSSQTM